MLILDLILLIAGLALLIKGADFFVDGASSVARAMGVPSLIIGLTLVSIGTSAPELSVSVTSALAGANDICFGNVIGSNVFNTFVVIGAAALFVNLTVTPDTGRFDLPILIGAYLILGALTFFFTPYTLGLVEAIILLALFAAYLIFLIARARRESADEDDTPATPRAWYINLALIAGGLFMIIFGGDLVVDHASSLAEALGLSPLLVGLTVVAIGTSLPELVTSIVAARRGEHDIAVGNAIGSSIFNIMLILGASAAIHPIRINVSSVIDLAAMLASAVLVWIFALRGGKIRRWQGIVLIAAYAAYMAYTIIVALA